MDHTGHNHDQVLPYGVLVFNCLLFYILRKIFKKLPLDDYQDFISEFISTLELCSGCAEMGVIYEVHGIKVMSGALFAICLWWSISFDGAEACNCTLLEDAIIYKKIETRSFLLKTTGMLLGAAFTKLYIMEIWSFHMTPQHEELHKAAECVAGLQVDIVTGAIIEGLLTFACRLVALGTSSWAFSACAVANSLSTVILVFAGFNYTGGFFNPILAVSLNIGCRGNSLFEHFVVYWFGAIVGGMLGRVLYESVLAPKGKDKLPLKVE